MATTYNNGILTATGLHIEGPTPVDDRTIVNTFADLATIPNKYNRLKTFVIDDDAEYLYDENSDSWTLFTGVNSVNDIIGTDGINVTGSSTRTISLGNITPDSVASIGIVTGSNLSGTNTGDETTSTIQIKRPLKTIEGQSLEGPGNIDLVKADVGLSNVDNTSDVNKPVSTAQLAAINAKVQDTIVDNVTTIAPSQNAVFDALQKVPKIIFVDCNTTTPVTGTTTETIMQSKLIPANSLSDGNLSFLVQVEKATGVTANMRVYLSTSPTNISVTPIAQIANVATNIVYQPIYRTVRIKNGMVMIHDTSSSTNYGEMPAAAPISNTLAINPANSLYLITTVTHATIIGSAKVNASELIFKKEQ